MRKILSMEVSDVMKHFKNVLCSVVFLLILFGSLFTINKILEAKYILKNSTWPTTSSYRQFYEMDKDSIDVLFFGSSVAVNAFIPQEIYNTYGITSYNLGSEQQSIYLSYYWLKEALRFQSPKVVVLDAKFMMNLHPENPINTTEGLTRKCLDPMKWSKVKREAVHNLCLLDEEQSELSYYLINLRYHSRWSRLQEYDINEDMVDISALKGYAPTTDYGPASYTTYEQTDASATTEFAPLMQEYLDKMADLCKENNIQLVLVDLPGNEMNDAINNTHTSYAEKRGIDYYNLCSTKYYEMIGAVLPKENTLSHENIWGAIKTSRFFGNLLKDTYKVEARQDEQFEVTKAFYEQTKKSADLVTISNQAEYLNALLNNNYAIFISVRGDASSVFNIPEVKEGLQNLGLTCELTDIPETSYVAAIVAGNVVAEEASAENVKYTGSFRDHHSIYTLQSCGLKGNPSTSIIIDGQEYSIANNGINFAIYDLTTYKIIDKVTFQGSAIMYANPTSSIVREQPV